MQELSVHLPRILIVDDEPIIIKTLNEMMKNIYDLQMATSGKQALSMALSGSDAPELILLDVGLQDMDGYEVCRRLRDNPATRDIPVIFLSNHDSREEVLQGFRVGGQDYVLKNAEITELMVRIGTHLQLYRQKAALESALEQNRIQNEKMAALGKLAAGVAHEINNPMGYIVANLQILARYYGQIVKFDRFLTDVAGSIPASVKDTIVTFRSSLDLDNILGDGVSLINESLEGAERVTKIVQDLKNFSRINVLEYEEVTLTSCLERALTICSNELKYVANVRKEYVSELEVLCQASQLNQVFLNLLVNAGQAIVPMGEIVLRSWHDEAFVYASVTDNGSGMTQEILERIFDPFYTTKPEGEGTGLGLNISHDIVAKHHGELLVESAVEVGTTFTVKLPQTRKLP